jgi:hypothetical protein
MAPPCHTNAPDLNGPNPFQDLMLLVIGCDEKTVEALANAGVKTIMDVITFTYHDLLNLCKIIHKKNSKLFLFVTEKNFRIVMSEARIRRHKERTLAVMHGSKVGDLLEWQNRQ